MSLRVHVIGAGVIGLTTAVCLLEAGHAVTVTARALPPHTTSNLAAAVWYPFIVEPRDRVRTWANATKARYLTLLDEPAAGVTLVDVTIFTPEPLWWVEELAPADGTRLPDVALPPGNALAYRVQTPLIETPLFMAYLLDRVRKLDGVVRQGDVADLVQAADGFDALVNCTGLGARELAADPRVHAVAGHVIPYAPGPDASASGLPYVMDEAVDDLDTVCYIFPRRDLVVVGGSEVVDGDATVRPELVARIRRRALALAPQLATREAGPVYVGLRPGRDAVRLERTALPDGTPVVHNYGHGGGGFTLCWGCARDVGVMIQPDLLSIE